MPKRGYKHPGCNVMCDHCSQLISKRIMDRAWLIGEHIESHQDVTIEDLEDALGISRELVNQALRAFRTHLTAQIGKGIVCIHVIGRGWVYQLTDEWQNDEGADIENYDRWMIKRVMAEMTHVRDITAIAFARIDGRKRRLKVDVAQLLSSMNTVLDQHGFIRERLLILNEELEEAS